MAHGSLKARSTKVAQPVPVEFRQLFVQYGWERVNHLFGKRASVRYFTVLGGDRLRAERNAHLNQRKSTLAGRYSSMAPIPVPAVSQGAGA